MQCGLQNVRCVFRVKPPFWNSCGVVCTRPQSVHLWQAGGHNANWSKSKKAEFAQIWEFSRTCVFLVLAYVCFGAVANTASAWVHRCCEIFLKCSIKNIKCLQGNTLRVSPLLTSAVHNLPEVTLWFLSSFSNDTRFLCSWDFFNWEQQITPKNTILGQETSFPSFWKIILQR